MPWLAIHIALPFYLALGWVWAPLLLRLSRRGRLAAALLMTAATVISLRNDFHLITDRMADPHERLVYNHTPLDFDHLCRSRVASWTATADRVPLTMRKVQLVGDTGWPGVWYFRHCAYVLSPQAPAWLTPDLDLVIGNEDLMKTLKARFDPQLWAVYTPPKEDLAGLSQYVIVARPLDGALAVGSRPRAMAEIIGWAEGQKMYRGLVALLLVPRDLDPAGTISPDRASTVEAKIVRGWRLEAGGGRREISMLSPVFSCCTSSPKPPASSLIRMVRTANQFIQQRVLFLQTI